MALSQDKEKRQWSRIVAAGLCPGISDFQTYEKLALLQFTHARKYALENAILAPTPIYAATIHRIIFENIHLWAGTFRQPGESVRFDDGVIGIDAHRVIPELTKVGEEFKAAVIAASRARKPETHAISLAVFHARYRRAHPFLDGNTRTSAVILESQVATIYGHPSLRIKPDTDYKSLLSQAYRGHVSPLANLILESVNLPLVQEMNIKIPPPMYDTDLETEITKNRARIIAQQRGEIIRPRPPMP